MQKYNNTDEKTNPAKDIVLDYIDFLRQKVEDETLTASEISSIACMFMEQLHLTGTIKDFAKFFDKPENQIRSLISRKVIDKPERRVIYHFRSILKAIPNSWKQHKE